MSSPNTLFDKLDDKISEINDVLDELEKQGTWWNAIDVLPANDREVLVANKQKQVFIASYDYDNKWWTSNDRSKMLDITHWMEKPEPPEEKK
jgi:hypothetical protein